MNLFLGIDIGTSLIKASLYDCYGKMYSSARVKNKTENSRKGYSEQNPAEIWDSVKNCINECIKRNIRENNITPEAVKAVACSGQGDGLWALDDNDNPIGNAILWNDNRSSNIITEWTKTGTLEKFYSNSGTVLWAGSAATILRWMKRYDNDKYNRIHTIFCCKDWINFKLTGKKATDYTDGTIPFMNIREKKIDLNQAEIIGLEDSIPKLTEIHESSSIIGEISKETSEETGLTAGTPVCTGLIDVSANAIGAGAIKAGQAFLIIGTTLLNAVVMDTPDIEPENMGSTIFNAIPGQWLRGFGSQSGTPNLDWLVREFNALYGDAEITDIYNKLTMEAAVSMPGSNGLLFLPYINGERAPFLNPSATGSFLGITQQTILADMIRAVLEGVAFSSRNSLELLDNNITEIIAVGGGASNSSWCRIFADITGVELKVPAPLELGTAGAAIIAAIGIGAIDNYSFREGGGSPREKIYKPDSRNKALYDDLFGLFLRSVQMMGESWDLNRQIRQKYENNIIESGW